MEHLNKIEHLGIAVRSLEEGNALYTKLLGVPPYKEEAVESEGVRTSFFKAGPNKIELLEATNRIALLPNSLKSVEKVCTTSPTP
jgi:methylmalonyl-CoA/ethylmalonyl-CoA epimerase